MDFIRWLMGEDRVVWQSFEGLSKQREGSLRANATSKRRNVLWIGGNGTIRCAIRHNQGYIKHERQNRSINVAIVVAALNRRGLGETAGHCEPCTILLHDARG